MILNEIISSDSLLKDIYGERKKVKSTLQRGEMPIIEESKEENKHMTSL